MMELVGLFSSGIKNQRVTGNLGTSLPLLAQDRYDGHDIHTLSPN